MKISKMLIALFFIVTISINIMADPAFDLDSRTDHPPLTSKDAYVNWMLQNTNEDEGYIRQRWDRLQVDIANYNNDQPDVLKEAFLRTPREHFARPYNSGNPYSPYPLGIEDGQTMSGPYIQIRMTLSILPDSDMKVLEIGTGSGAQSALLAQLTNHVYSIEIKENAYNVTKDIYDRLRPNYPEYNNVHMVHADGYYGWLEEYGWDEDGPIEFDRIIVTCGIDHIPPPLLRQLAPGGIMVIPVGTRYSQAILAITKHVDEDGSVYTERVDIYGGRLKDTFVPFTDTSGGNHANGW